MKIACKVYPILFDILKFEPYKLSQNGTNEAAGLAKIASKANMNMSWLNSQRL